MISSSIFNNPYSDGNPFVDVTVTIPAEDDKLCVSVVCPVTTSGTRLSSFKYWSRFSAISTVPPWNSCEM